MRLGRVAEVPEAKPTRERGPKGKCSLHSVESRKQGNSPLDSFTRPPGRVPGDLEEGLLGLRQKWTPDDPIRSGLDVELFD